MPKIKPIRHSPRLDMTPMVDLAFLLVTFFMLTTKFRPDEAVQVQMPTSTAPMPRPEKNLAEITIANDGRIFYDIQGKYNRQEVIKKVVAKMKQPN